MMMPVTRPLERLIEEEKVMDRKTFYNLRLGMPWRPVGGSMTSAMFRDMAFTTGHEMQRHRTKGYRYYVGADQGNDIHVVVGRVMDGSERIEVVYAEHIKPRVSGSQFDALAAIIRAFDADFVLCDANPNRSSAINLAREFHGKMGVVDIGDYSYAYKWNGFDGEAAYRMSCTRTDILDGLRDDIGAGRITLWGNWLSRDREVKQIIDHCSNMKRDTMQRKMKSGGEKVVGVWRSVGPDHFAFSMALLRIAAIAAPRVSSFDFRVAGDNSRDNSDSRDDDNKKRKKSKVWEGVSYEY